MLPIFGLTPKEVHQQVERLGQPKYRATQVLDWLYQKKISRLDEMTNLPKDFLKKLNENFSLDHPEVQTWISKDGTRKFCFLWKGQFFAESVWIPEKKRNTLCISSQLGCGMGCTFCVTGTLGFRRNLTTEEMVHQVRYVKLIQGLPVSNVVFMGMGEPFLNLSEVEKAIEIFSSTEGLCLGRRKIVVSTVGSFSSLSQFIKKNRVKVAISLTGGTKSTLERWMPVHQKYPIQDLFRALQEVPMQPGHQFMFEVVLIAGETDSLEEAQGLAQWLRKLPAKVNLIPYNENSFFPHLKSPSQEQVDAFRKVLVQAGIPVTLRKNRGSDIMGACGQLGYSVIQKKGLSHETN